MVLKYVKRILRRFGTRRFLSQFLRTCCRQHEKTANDHSGDVPSQIVFVSDSHVYGGYYDICPFNRTETKILALCVDQPNAPPRPGTLATVGVFDSSAETPQWKQLGHTTAWNWQQGCRLRWFPDQLSQAVMYNVTRADHYASVIQDIQTKQILREISYPLYDLDPSGRWGVTLNFSRLHRMRPGYGYADLPDETAGDLCPSNDGVWLVDLDADDAKLLSSLADLAEIAPHDSMAQAEHYINHLSFSPDGGSFLFLHLWVNSAGRRFSRLFTAKRDGTGLSLLNNTGHVSHYTWLSSSRLVVVTYVSRGEPRYVVYDLTDGFCEIIGLRELIQDGHPSFLKSGRWMITDTYPDQARIQSLLLYDSEEKRLHTLAQFFTPTDFSGEVRCDLHPRISPSERRIAVDTVVDGRRAIALVDIPEWATSTSADSPGRPM